MNKFITTFADFEVDNNSGEAIGYESAVELKEPEYPISEDDAQHFVLAFEDACDEVDYDALREAEADEAWQNLRDELHPERAAITTAIADCEAAFIK